jgi:hypothetical protein
VHIGANVVIGGDAPIRGMIDAIGHAATVLANEQHPAAVALPCTSVAKGRDTAVIINADDSVVAAAAEAGLLFGAYHNIISTVGVSPLWNGYVGSATTPNTAAVPQVAINGHAAIAIQPNNLAYPAKHIVFYEKGANKGTLSAEDATKKIMEITGETKLEAVTAILQGAKVSVIGSAGDVKSIL